MSDILDNIQDRFQCGQAQFQEAETESMKSANITEHLQKIGEEQKRMTAIYRSPTVIIQDIDEQFKKATKLNSTDIIFLFLATAMQCARQYILPNDKLRLTAKQGDELLERTVGTVLEPIKPEWNEVLFLSVPYDAIKTSSHVQETGIAGTTHRYRTLGHDPVLGWVFGTANIMTNSLTKTDFISTYQVSNMTLIRRYPGGTAGMLARTLKYASDDPKLLMASVARQAIHFGTDYFTKQGLPVPVIAVVNNDLAKDMINKGHIDMYSITRGATIAAFINALVRIVHNMLYDESTDGSHSLYEVRTRKILSYSNLIASTSNVVVTAVTKNLNTLDIGGLLVTIHRIVNDAKFIREIKQDFLKNELADRIYGTPYVFMEDIQ